MTTMTYSKVLGGRGGVEANAGWVSAVGPTKAAATKALYETALESAQHVSRGYLYCGDGTMLSVGWMGGAWGYDICRPDGHASCMGARSRDEAIRQAVSHAEQSYGGVVGRSHYSHA